MPDDSYVTNAAWTAKPGRPDAIDEIADQFERPSGAAAFWDAHSSGAANDGYDLLTRFARRSSHRRGLAALA